MLTDGLGRDRGGGPDLVRNNRGYVIDAYNNNTGHEPIYILASDAHICKRGYVGDP